MLDYLSLGSLSFLAIIFFFFFTVLRYKYSIPGNVLIVFDKFSKNKKPKCYHGGGTYVLPFIQDYTYLSLKPISSIIYLSKCLTKNKDYRVNIRLFFSFCIGTDEKLLNFASERLIRMPETEINILATEIIKEQLIFIIASFPPEKTTIENKEFVETIKTTIEPELNKIGLILISASATKIDYFEKNKLLKEDDFRQKFNLK